MMRKSKWPPNENAAARAGAAAVSLDVRFRRANDADTTENLPTDQSLPELWLRHRRHLSPLRAKLIAEIAFRGGVE